MGNRTQASLKIGHTEEKSPAGVTYRMVLEIHGFSERLRVFTLKYVSDQVLALGLPGISVRHHLHSGLQSPSTHTVVCDHLSSWPSFRFRVSNFTVFIRRPEDVPGDSESSSYRSKLKYVY